MTFLGNQTIGELNDLLANWDPRMADLGNAFAQFSPQWVNSDPGTFEDWSNDWAALGDRWTAARSAAQTFLNETSILPASTTSAQGAYDSIMKAIRQNYPPDGAAIKKGDWDDLYQRLTAAMGHAPPITTVQPTATDFDQQVLAATQPLDVLGMITGQIAPPKPSTAPSTPTSGIGWAFVGIMAGIAGAFGGSVMGPPGAIAGAAVGGVLGYELKNKISASLPSWL